MQKLLRLAVLTLVCSLMFFSCASEDKQEERGPQRMSESRQTGNNQNLNRPDESEHSLIQLQAFVDESARADLVLSAEQAEKILPVLIEWKTALASDSKTDGKAFAAKISEHLTGTQKEYRPEPPKGGPGNGEQAEPSGQRGPGAPRAEFSVMLILDELIEALSAL